MAVGQSEKTAEEGAVWRRVAMAIKMVDRVMHRGDAVGQLWVWVV